ncbi:uncharacterized protein CLAFUR5_06155 [Fulvia fulva]|uniref:Uncharacterized protein n=1 Tax=Passalora fulva TaxID=5499 RepID=A0A9Q8LHV0_PASFU|nr:uncharacterized protein CLAFUR5_06155 [Fulvia fulva]KAK4625602.1 hypothetical protein CLAFUR0_06019 [Fulvia fulva]UJO17673.1 hypothetical protein CLAFUR5_06155 [Fulvia fulva]
MYRNPNGGYGFSFSAFANNSIPSMMKDSTTDPGHISTPQKNFVFLHQTAGPPGQDHSPYGFDD